MASFTYYLDCPQCGQSETVRIEVHASRNEDLWAATPKVFCGCSLTVEEVEEASEEAVEMAVDDFWDWSNQTDDDERFDRRRERDMEGE